MRQPLFALVVLLAFAHSDFCHGQYVRWLEHYGNQRQNAGVQLAFGTDGMLFGVGRFTGPDLQLGTQSVTAQGSVDILVVRWDTTGQVIWAERAGGICFPSEHESGGLIAYDVIAQQVLISGQFNCPSTSFGSHVIVGSGGNMSGDRYLAAYDITGVCLWAKAINGFDVDVWSTLIDAASNIHVIGQAEVAGATFQTTPWVGVPLGGFIAQYGSDGSLVHAERVLTNGEFFRADWGDAETWLLTGAAKPGVNLFGQGLSVVSPDRDGFLARVDTTGDVDWVTMFPSNNSCRLLDCKRLSDGRIMAYGYFVEDLLLPEDTLYGEEGVWTYFLSMLDASGQVQWTQPVVSTEGAFLHDLEVDANDDALLYGRYVGSLTVDGHVLPPRASSSGFMARFSPGGTCESAWSFGRMFGGTGSILTTDHGLYLSAGFDSTLVLGNYTVQSSYTGTALAQNDLMIARIDSLSGFTGVQSLALEDDNTLHIYANPSNGLCTVDLPDAIAPGSSLVLSIYDATGRVVQQVPLTIQGGTVQLDIQAQAKGIYHVELQDGAKRYTGQIVFE